MSYFLAMLVHSNFISLATVIDQHVCHYAYMCTNNYDIHLPKLAAMLTSSGSEGQTGGPAAGAVASSRIPIAKSKHRQSSPENQHFSSPHNNHFQQQQQLSSSPVSRLPKYQTNAQHESSSGTSGGGSGESEDGGAITNNNKRRKDSAGSITGLHGMAGNLL